MEPGQEHTAHGGQVSFFSLTALISPSSTREPVLTKNSSQFPYLGPWSNSLVYILENTHVPSADLGKKKKRKKLKPNATTTKTILAFVPIPGT